MKLKLIIVSVFSILSILGLAKGEYESGFVITYENDTIKGLFKVRDIQSKCAGFALYSEQLKKIKLDKNNVKEYYQKGEKFIRLFPNKKLFFKPSRKGKVIQLYEFYSRGNAIATNTSGMPLGSISESIEYYIEIEQSIFKVTNALLKTHLPALYEKNDLQLSSNHRFDKWNIKHYVDELNGKYKGNKSTLSALQLFDFRDRNYAFQEKINKYTNITWSDSKKMLELPTSQIDSLFIGMIKLDKEKFVITFKEFDQFFDTDDTLKVLQKLKWIAYYMKDNVDHKPIYKALEEKTFKRNLIDKNTYAIQSKNQSFYLERKYINGNRYVSILLDRK